VCLQFVKQTKGSISLSTRKLESNYRFEPQQIELPRQESRNCLTVSLIVLSEKLLSHWDIIWKEKD